MNDKSPEHKEPPRENHKDSKDVNASSYGARGFFESIADKANKAKSRMNLAALELMGWVIPSEGPDYLEQSDSDHRFVIAYVDALNEQFESDPDAKRTGWEEIWLPQAVYDQCVKDALGNPVLDKDGKPQPRVTTAQAERLLATLSFRAQMFKQGNPHE